MKAYFSIVKMRFILLLQYRVAAFSGLFTNFFFGLVRVMVYFAFYHSAAVQQPITYTQTITYIWLGQSLISMMPWGGDSDIQNLIRTGNVAYELCRPINLYYHWFCRAIALRSAPTLLRAFPILVILLFLLPEEYSLAFPHSFAGAMACLVAIIGAILISSAITNIINISTIWTMSARGIKILIMAIVNIFSGIIVPLPFFPDWMQKIINLLPFRGLIDIPVRFYIGDLPPWQIGVYFIQQLAWVVILVAIGQWILHKKLKDIVVQGG